MNCSNRAVYGVCARGRDRQIAARESARGTSVALKQALNLYDSYQSSIGECDEQLARVLGKLAAHDGPPADPPNSGRGRPVKVPTFDLGTALYRTCDVDLTRIDGIDVVTALNMVAGASQRVANRLAQSPRMVVVAAGKAPRHWELTIAACPLGSVRPKPSAPRPINWRV